ncbi:MAG: hypothetical protein KA436_02185 [Oligoflexales bacterium]|nr:hypothetical protein [Oligoflexales bacterium]
MADKWLSIVEYARHFNISDMTVRRRIKTGRLSAELKEGKYYICLHDKAHLREPVANRETPSPRASGMREYSASPVQKIDKTPFRRPEFRREYLSSDSGHSSQIEDQRHLYDAQTGDTSFPSLTPSSDVTTPSKNAFYPMIPSHLNSALKDRSTLLVETNELLHLCDSTLRAAKEHEKILEKNNNAQISLLEQKIRSLESEIQVRDQRIIKLTQDVEDLTLLVKMMERQPGAEN